LAPIIFPIAIGALFVIPEIIATNSSGREVQTAKNMNPTASFDKLNIFDTRIELLTTHLLL